MRKLNLGGAAVVVLACALGCGGSGSDRGSGTVDPASQDFCLHWANDVCRLAYLCVDAGAQDSAFHSRYGQSLDDCWQSVEKYCTSNQSGGQTFGPSCGAGKKVSTDLANLCTDSLEAETCASWTVAPAGACDAVCSAAGNTGVAGAPGIVSGGAGTGAGGMGSGSGGTSNGALATAGEFCTTQQTVLCERIFECLPARGAADYGTLADCKTQVVSICSSASFCTMSYDASKARLCVAAAKAATCEQLMGAPPEVCTSACQ